MGASRAARNRSFIPLSKAGVQALPQWTTTHVVGGVWGGALLAQGGAGECGRGSLSAATAAPAIRPSPPKTAPGHRPRGTAPRRWPSLRQTAPEPPHWPAAQAEFRDRPIDLSANKAMAAAVSSMFK